MNNPFETINARLSNLEAMAAESLQLLRSAYTPPPVVGGIPLAKEVTRLSDGRIYALVAARKIPHSKRGNKLYFNRADLLDWVNQGKRAEFNNSRDEVIVPQAAVTKRKATR